jgi:hypothetical protein
VIELTEAASGRARVHVGGQMPFTALIRPGPPGPLADGLALAGHPAAGTPHGPAK